MKLKNNLYFITTAGVCVNIIGLIQIDNIFYYLYSKEDYNIYMPYSRLQGNRHILFGKLKINNLKVGVISYNNTRVDISLRAKEIMNKFIKNDI